MTECGLCSYELVGETCPDCMDTPAVAALLAERDALRAEIERLKAKVERLAKYAQNARVNLDRAEMAEDEIDRLKAKVERWRTVVSDLLDDAEVERLRDRLADAGLIAPTTPKSTTRVLNFD